MPAEHLCGRWSPLASRNWASIASGRTASPITQRRRAAWRAGHAPGRPAARAVSISKAAGGTRCYTRSQPEWRNAAHAAAPRVSDDSTDVQVASNPVHPPPPVLVERAEGCGWPCQQLRSSRFFFILFYDLRISMQTTRCRASVCWSLDSGTGIGRAVVPYVRGLRMSSCITPAAWKAPKPL